MNYRVTVKVENLKTGEVFDQAVDVEHIKIEMGNATQQEGGVSSPRYRLIGKRFGLLTWSGNVEGYEDEHFRKVGT